MNNAGQVTLIWSCETLDVIDVRNLSPFAAHDSASGDSLRPKAGLPAEALAKVGGGPAIQPPLVPFRRFEIQGAALVA